MLRMLLWCFVPLSFVGVCFARDDHVIAAQTGPGRGLSQEQINVMQHATSLFVASKWCTNYVVDLSTINEAVRRAKINANTEPHKSYLEQRLREIQKSVASAGAIIACAVFYDNYGPSGKAVPGQMIRK